MELNALLSLSVDDVHNKPLPLMQLLESSLYYPSSRLDGGVIKYCNMHLSGEQINSFVYCDYSCEESDLVARAKDDFVGYHVFAHRTVLKEEIGADRMPLNIIPSPDEQRRFERFYGRRMFMRLYCHWLIMERDENFDDSHGPERFSLLYVRGDGVQAYSGLYAVNKISPKVLAIMQAGYSYEGYWTRFDDKNGCLYNFMNRVPERMPQYVFYGGADDARYDNLDWPGYEIVDRVGSYYRPNYGELVVYKRS